MSRSSAKNRVFTSLLHCLRVKVKGRGQGQRSGSRSNLRHAAVNIRGSALPSAIKSNYHHYQSKVIVCADAVDRRLISIWKSSNWDWDLLEKLPSPLKYCM